MVQKIFNNNRPKQSLVSTLGNVIYKLVVYFNIAKGECYVVHKNNLSQGDNF